MLKPLKICRLRLLIAQAENNDDTMNPERELELSLEVFFYYQYFNLIIAFNFITISTLYHLSVTPYKYF